jgi:FkbM family methyltransferase
VPLGAKKKALAATKVAPSGKRGRVGFIPYGRSGIEIAVRDGIVSELVQEKIRSGSYEKRESAMAERIVTADEIVLELGAGVGLISTVVGRTGKAKQIHCFEADERLLPLINETHTRNGITDVNLYHSAITSDLECLKRGYIEFHLRESFWGNSTNANVGREVQSVVKVKTTKFADIIQLIQPTIIIADIEGAEMGLFSGVDLACVQAILLEVHLNVLGPQGMRNLFDDLHRAGFYYDPYISSGQVPGFRRG